MLVVGTDAGAGAGAAGGAGVAATAGAGVDGGFEDEAADAGAALGYHKSQIIAETTQRAGIPLRSYRQ